MALQVKDRVEIQMDDREHQGIGLAVNDLIKDLSSDIRGAIYGIYEFSRSALGVHPLYLWTDHRAAAIGSLDFSSIFLTDGARSP